MTSAFGGFGGDDFEGEFGDDMMDAMDFMPMGGMGGGAQTGPVPVFFTCFVDPAPPEDVAVGIVVKSPTGSQMVAPTLMNHAQGDRTIWTIQAMLNPTEVEGLARGRGGAGRRPPGGGRMGGGMFGAGGLLGGLGGDEKEELPTLFSVNYLLANATTGDVRDQDPGRAETGNRLNSFYYHKAKFGRDTDAEPFPRLISNEIHAIQFTPALLPDFDRRFEDLLKTKSFSTDVKLFYAAIDALIAEWAGQQPSATCMVVIAAMIGILKKREDSKAHRGRGDFMMEMMGMGGGVLGGGGKDKKEKEKPPPLPENICNYITDKWRNDQIDRIGQAEQDPAGGAGAKGEGRGGGRQGADDSRKIHRIKQKGYEGLRECAETLYKESHSFAWLALLQQSVDERYFPSPISVSEQDNEAAAKKLSKSFEVQATQMINAMIQVLFDQSQMIERIQDVKQKNYVEMQLQRYVERVLGGLFRYSPSIAELRWLFDRVNNFVGDQAKHMELGELCRQRFRNIRFGPEDKKALRLMIREVRQIQNEETANSLLENIHHPSKAFQADEIIDMVKEIMAKCGNHSNGPLVECVKRWLRRHFSRNVKTGTDDRYDDEIRKATANALVGWELALSLPCFDRMQEYQILFELEQSHFFKDPEPIALINCLLDLEDRVQAIRHAGLRETVSKVANRTIRGAQETVEEFTTNHILLQLLFQQPTPLRYEFVEMLMQQRTAFPGLRSMLNNEALWRLLLSDRWDPSNAKDISRSNLGSIQVDGKRLLDSTRKGCKNSTCTLGELSAIGEKHRVFVDLAKLATGEDLKALVADVIKRHKEFDKKHEQLGIYAKMFCSNSEPTIGQIDVRDVTDLVEQVRDEYDTIQLKDAMPKIDKVLVWPHLDFLYALRGSNVFAGIWTAARGTAPLTQKQVVDKVIKEAQNSWEKLANGIVSGSIVMGEVMWIVQYPADEVKTELRNLEQTSKAKGDWSKAQEAADSMRLANRLRDVAPAVLTVREALNVLFTCPMESDAGVPSITKLRDDMSRMFDTQFGKCSAMVAPHRQVLAMLNEKQEDFFLQAATKTSPVSYLVEANECITLEGFNGLIEVSRPMTDDPRVLGALAAMQQVRTQLAQAFYKDQGVKKYSRIQEFLNAIGSIEFKEIDLQSLEAMQVNFDPLLNLLQSKSRSPGVQACFDLRMLCESGTFKITCTPKRGDQIVCHVKDGKPWRRQELQDLGQQLLMTDVPEEIEGQDQLLILREEFIKKCQFLNEYSQYIQELFNLGYFALEEGEERLQITPQDSVENVAAHVENIKNDLETWESDVTAARGTHYFLNYFTVFELRLLAKSLRNFAKGGQGQNPAWFRLWPMLRTVAPKANSDTTKRRLSSSPLLSKFADIREASLESLGDLLNGLFNDIELQVRLLTGLPQLNADEQGDLVIRKNAEGETGVPIFVCSVDDETKVTEAVLSIYARRERVPEAEELVFCNTSTTAEEIELLARRFFTARKQGREDRVFCLGSVHLLPYGVQCRAAEVMRWLEERLGFKDASCLAVVSGGPRQQVLSNALLSRKAHAVGFPKEPRDGFLREAVMAVGRDYHGRQIEAFAADINGAGKTHKILTKVSDIEATAGCPVYHRVDLRESTDAANLTEALTSDPTDVTKPSAIHLNLAHILQTHVDTLLFQLLIVGVLHDARLGVIYHRRPEDMYFVEIPNTPNEHTAKSLPFVMLLPRTFIKMGPDALDYYRPVISNYTDHAHGSSITVQKNEDLVIVTKYLLAMENEAFNPLNKTNFKIDWDRNKEPELSKEQAYELLDKACALEGEAPSFLLFTGFVKFLSNLLQLQEKFPVGTNLGLQKQLHFTGLKQSFTRLLIETSRAFALRQIPKGHADFETHPLAPPAPSAPALIRQMSLTREPSLKREVSLAGGPSLARQTSRARTNATATGRPENTDTQSAPVDALAVETSGVGRIVVTSYVSRFAKMQSWESMEHPVAYFVMGATGNVQGLQVMCFNHEYISQFVSQQLQRTLALQGIHLNKDWSQAKHEEQVKCVLDVEGGRVSLDKNSIRGPEEYVVTVDNLLKLMTIQQRLRYGLPVCLMGETGCGKTALVRFLSKTLEVPLLTLDIHGGITEVEILGFMDRAIRRANELPAGCNGVMVFFDEVNACNCLGLFKTLIIDRMHRGYALPREVRIISCCNPYRTRMNKEDEQVGCQFEHKGLDGEATGITDPMRDLVYRVHPLPESLMDIVSDFGALSENSESLYIRAILTKELMPPVAIEEQKKLKAREAAAAAKAAPRSFAAPKAAAAAPAKKEDEDDTEYDRYISAFRDLICCSQIFLREVNNGERSVVSMRDVARAVKVCKWFLTYYAKVLGVQSPAEVAGDSKQLSHGVSSPAVRICVDEQMRQHLRSAVILTLGYCYHARLNREDRALYLKRLSETFSTMAAKTPAIAWLNLGSAATLDAEMIDVQKVFVGEMQLGEGIALNEALRENLFMLLVSIMNQIPILIVGKPGCSKSLAMDVLKANLNGEVSEREFFRSMPALSVFAYQCSPLSTPDAILYAFNSARQSNIGDTKRIVCVLLDEVGLAEESPHLPLKVLHRELEHLEGITCVGISNWSLDAAKMNRCVMLYRPPPTVEDLRKTAEGMAGRSANLKAYLHSLSEAFYEIYTTQRQKDFWGMREFYSTIRALSNELKLQAKEGREQAIEPNMVMKVVLRNFGGRPEEEMEHVIEEYFDRLGFKSVGIPRIPKDQLIRQNLVDKDARHLMLLTKNNAALRLLFETGLLGHNGAEVLFGGTFPADQSDLFVASNLQRVKTYMQRPCCLIMIHCDALYESLYDLLNQHYMEYAGQRYVRIAHGSLSKQCPIHEMFRIIVVVEEYDAYNKLAPPLLNRFEKQLFQRKDLMEKGDIALRNKVEQFWSALMSGLHIDGGGSKARIAIAGHHSDILASLVFAIRRRKENAELVSEGKDEELFQQARNAMIWVLTPEAVCLTAASTRLQQALRGFDIVDEYFKKQMHVDLPGFVSTILDDKSLWCDEVGSQIVAMTYSPLRGRVADITANAVSGKQINVIEIMLHELAASTDLVKDVNEFYKSADTSKYNMLLIRADTAECSLRQIEYTRCICEKARNDFTGQAGDGAVIVLLLIHLERGDSGFSFDFVSNWQFTFLDSIEPVAADDMCGLPALSDMLHVPLLKVLETCDFKTLLRRSFRESLAHLVYKQRRQSGDLQAQVQQLLVDLDDDEFVSLFREWTTNVLQTTEKKSRRKRKDADVDGADEIRPEKKTVGEDPQWFADVAGATHELMLSGTLRAALHQRILTMMTSLLTAFMAHLDRNGCYELLSDANKRSLWLLLAPASTVSAMASKLKREGEECVRESTALRREVPTDALTQDQPFRSQFPFSWFISKTIDDLQRVVRAKPQEEHQAALDTNWKMTPLHGINFDPCPSAELLDAYIADFTAMHVDFMHGIDRPKQHQILRAVLKRANGGDLVSILDVHRLFWVYEQQIRFCVGLVDAVPTALDQVEKLVEAAPIHELNAQLLLSVHRLLIQELLDKPESGDPQKDYYQWMYQKMMVAGITEDFFVEGQHVKDLKGAPPLIQEIKNDTEPRIDTIANYIRHVAYPLKLSLDEVKKFITDMPASGQVRCSSCFASVLKATDRCLQEGGPVGRGYERNDVIGQCRLFVQSWILEVCLAKPATSIFVEKNLVRLFCHLATGLPVKLEPKTTAGVTAVGLADGEADSSYDEEKELQPLALLSDEFLPRLPSLNLALLRTLINGLEGDVKTDANSTLKELLNRFVQMKGHNDSVFAKDFCIVNEEKAGKRLQSTSIGKWLKLSLEKMADTSKPDMALLLVGHARWQFIQYAAAFCQQEPPLGEIQAMEERFGNDVLCVFEGPHAALSRSFRLFVLKLMERAKGVTFLRGALAGEPLCRSPWVSQWRGRHDLNFEKFIGSTKVPTWTPFITDDMPAEFANARTAVNACIASQSAAKLDNLFNGSSKWPEYQRRRQVGCLLMALCAEPGMLSPLEEVGRAKPPWRPVLYQWLETSTAIPCSAHERRLLRVFAGDNSILQRLNDGPIGDQQTEHILFKLFSIEGGRPMDSLFMWRYLGHLAGSLIATSNTSLLATLRTLMLEPNTMMSSKNADYIPSMDEDIRHRIQRAFGQGAGYQFANHWYKCATCGMKFYIGECSKPMQEAKCPQCHAVIGGSSHRPTAQTVQDENVDSSPAGYTLPKAAEDEKQLFFRDIHATSARAMRLLLHGTMMCGLVAHLPDGNASDASASPGPAPLLSRSESRKAARDQAASTKDSKGKELVPKVFGHITNTDSTCTMHQDSESVYLSNHLIQDWSLLADNLSSHGEGVAMGMHNLLQTMSKKAPDPPQAKKGKSEAWWDKQREGANDNSSEWARCLTIQRRAQWEETMDERYLLPWINKFEESLVTLHKKWNNKEDESGPFVAELRETADVTDFPKDRRLNEMPMVMAYRAEVTITEVARRLPQAKKEYNLTVLSTLMETHILETAGALRTLVGQFSWHSLVNQRFSGRITRQEARDMIIRDVIDAEPFQEKSNWEHAFVKMEDAWREAWPYVDRFECLDIPQHLKDAVGYIDDKKPLAYAIADDKDVGICPFVLTQWLVARHNDLVQAAAIAGGYPIRKVSSGNFGPHDAIFYDKTILMSFIRDRCVTHGAAGKLNLDLVELERHLRHEFQRPELSFELKPMFQWLGEGGGGANTLAALVPQRELTPEVEGRICNEIRTKMQANICLSKVQMASTFIVNSKDALSTDALGNMKLSDYLTQVLSDESDSMPSATARAEVCICNVDAFTRVLNRIIYPDPMEELPVQFKAEMPADIKDGLEKAAMALEIEKREKAVSAMEGLVNMVKNEPPNAEQKLSDWLPFAIEYSLGDAECAADVEKILPANLLIKHWEDTYKVFKRTVESSED